MSEALQARARNDVRVTASGKRRLYVAFALRRLRRSRRAAVRVRGAGAQLYAALSVAALVQRVWATDDVARRGALRVRTRVARVGGRPAVAVRLARAGAAVRAGDGVMTSDEYERMDEQSADDESLTSDTDDEAVVAHANDDATEKAAKPR